MPVGHNSAGHAYFGRAAATVDFVMRLAFPSSPKSAMLATGGAAAGYDTVEQLDT